MALGHRKSPYIPEHLASVGRDGSQAPPFQAENVSATSPLGALFLSALLLGAGAGLGALVLDALWSPGKISELAEIVAHEGVTLELPSSFEVHRDASETAELFDDADVTTYLRRDPKEFVLYATHDPAEGEVVISVWVYRFPAPPGAVVSAREYVDASVRPMLGQKGWSVLGDADVRAGVEGYRAVRLDSETSHPDGASEHKTIWVVEGDDEMGIFEYNAPVEEYDRFADVFDGATDSVRLG